MIRKLPSPPSRKLYPLYRRLDHMIIYHTYNIYTQFDTRDLFVYPIYSSYSHTNRLTKKKQTKTDAITSLFSLFLSLAERNNVKRNTK